MNCHYCNNSTGMCDMCRPRGQQMTEHEKIKPCPFCGDRERLYWDLSADCTGSPMCGCFGCGAHVTHGTVADAIAAWNRRADIDQPSSIP